MGEYSIQTQKNFNASQATTPATQPDFFSDTPGLLACRLTQVFMDQLQVASGFLILKAFA